MSVLIAYDNWLARAELPAPGCQPALVVPLDHTNVIPLEWPRRPLQIVEERIAQNWNGVCRLAGEVKALGDRLQASDEEIDDTTPWWRNPYFGPLDARTAYGLIGIARPRQIVEIGSGHSTRFMRRAIADFQLDTRLTSIDPSPRISVAASAHEHISQPVTSVEPAFFDRLGANDVLFLDGSHLVVPGSDVNFVLLEVLPRLSPGVIVHVHDIYLPEAYPARCERLYYGEQYLLAAVLTFGNDWESIVPVHYLTCRNVWDPEGCSYWIQRRGSGGTLIDR